MTYRRPSLPSLTIARELQEARLERWLADALATYRVREQRWDRRLAIGFYLSGLPAIIGAVLDSGALAIPGMLGVVVTLMGMGIVARQKAAIEREAVRRGLPHERLEEIAAERSIVGFDGWRHRCDVRFRWLCWEAGEVMPRERWYALADDLAEFSGLDARQQQFVQAMRAERDRQELSEDVALAS